MNIDDIKELVIKAGLKLVESGLIVRTWGNVSCRIDDNHFAITPSGMDYLKIKPEHIVLVRIADYGYDGNIKPSSERGIHAEVYKQYPDVNFIIHTHQENASIVSASGLDSVVLSENFGRVVCAAYGLPGTKKLRTNICKALSVTNVHAVIMKNHGALCFGSSFDQAFETAEQLEIACEEYIETQYLKRSGKSVVDAYEMADFALASSKLDARQDSSPLYNSKRTVNGYVFLDYAGTELSNVPVEVAALHNEIYNSCKSINHVHYVCTPEIAAIANNHISLKPLLDDFAQIIGTVAKNVEFDAKRISREIRKSSVVFVPGYGALCCGKTKDDAVVAQLLTQKACKAFIGTSIINKPCQINPFECMLMRFVYVKKYSKQIDHK